MTSPQADAKPIQSPRNVLATRITGVVFWGLVVIGLVLAFIQSYGLNNQVRADYEATSDRIALKLHQTLNDTPPVPASLMRDLLGQWRAEYGYSGIHVVYDGQKVEIGESLPDGLSLAREFTYLNRRAGQHTHSVFKLRIDYPNPDEAVSQLRKTLLVTLGGLFTAFGFILQWVLQRILTRPFMHMVDTAQAISAGQNELRFNEERADEFGFLARFINKSLDYLTQQRNALSEALQRIRQSEAELFQEKERAEVTLHSIGDAVITTDAQGHIEYINPVAEQLTGWRQQEIRGLNVADILQIIDESTREPQDNPVLLCLSTGDVVEARQRSALIRRDGEELAISDSAAPIRDRNGRIIGAVMVFQDVTTTRNLSHQLAYQAAHDPLTGLYNRREFERQLQLALGSAHQENSHHVLCYLDLDQFKVVNDTCGHVAGDELLRQLSGMLQVEIRDSDVLARLGGDELGILLWRCSMEKAAGICEKIRQRVQELRFSWNDHVFEVTVTIGLAGISAETETLSDLMSAADIACYAAKDLGRNRVHIYQPDDNELIRRHGEMQWVSRITKAIDENRLVLFYQPIVPVVPAPGAETHYEILIRMREEDGSLISPMAFIPAAERYNLMPAIDRWVVRTTLEYMRRQAAQGVSNAYAINLSGQSLGDHKLLDDIAGQISESGVDPGRLSFEVTETAAITHLAHATRFIAGLREKGCRFALDDFGSGLSSFAYLKNLQVDYLKIDGCFVRNMATDRIDNAMVEAIARVGKVMGIKTIAEFVENAEIMAELGRLGVVYAQGWHIAKAAPMDDWDGTAAAHVAGA